MEVKARFSSVTEEELNDKRNNINSKNTIVAKMLRKLSEKA